MFKKLVLGFAGLVVGIGIGYFLVNYTSLIPNKNKVLGENTEVSKKQVIGFLPYWNLDKASTDYSGKITTLAYFGVRVDGNGNIVKLSTPTQSEPGYYSLESGKLDSFLDNARSNKVTLSLVVNSGSVSDIQALVSDPIAHADNLASDLSPIMDKYGFSDVNLDIEYVNRATGVERNNFTKFVSEVKKKMPDKTLTVEIANGDPIKPSLIDVPQIGKIADNVVLMAYDFHYSGSFVSGPVAPIGGAGSSSEYDVSSALTSTLVSVPSNKLILGIPLYGYEWEEVGSGPRTSTIPNSGVIASNSRAQDLISSCADCVVKNDTVADEKYITFFDSGSQTNHIIYFPDEDSTSAKIKLADSSSLEGLALWALGYEGDNILSPLTSYINN